MVRIKARVFHRQQAVFHQRRNLVDALVDAPLGAKAANFHAVRGQYAQRLFGLVVGQEGRIR